MAMLQGYNFAGGPVYPGKKKKEKQEDDVKIPDTPQLGYWEGKSVHVHFISHEMSQTLVFANRRK